MLSSDYSEIRVLQSKLETAAPRRVHEGQSAQYSHELPPESKESAGRVVIRLVPLLYGGLFGSLIKDIPLAMGIALAVSAVVDLAMGDRSVLRSLIRPLTRTS